MKFFPKDYILRGFRKSRMNNVRFLGWAGVELGVFGWISSCSAYQFYIVQSYLTETLWKVHFSDKIKYDFLVAYRQIFI